MPDNYDPPRPNLNPYLELHRQLPDGEPRDNAGNIIRRRPIRVSSIFGGALGGAQWSEFYFLLTGVSQVRLLGWFWLPMVIVGAMTGNIMADAGRGFDFKTFCFHWSHKDTYQLREERRFSLLAGFMAAIFVPPFLMMSAGLTPHPPEVDWMVFCGEFAVAWAVVMLIARSEP